jgi:hypothetical protein
VSSTYKIRAVSCVACTHKAAGKPTMITTPVQSQLNDTQLSNNNRTIHRPYSCDVAVTRDTLMTNRIIDYHPAYDPAPYDRFGISCTSHLLTSSMFYSQYTLFSFRQGFSQLWGNRRITRVWVYLWLLFCPQFYATFRNADFRHCCKFHRLVFLTEKLIGQFWKFTNQLHCVTVTVHSPLSWCVN